MSELKFDMVEAKDIATKLSSKDEYIDYDYQQGRAAAMLPAAIDRIEELERLLCIESAISLHNFQRYEALKAAIGEGRTEREQYTEMPSWDDLPEEQRKAIIEVHREMLRVEGKL